MGSSDEERRDRGSCKGGLFLEIRTRIVFWRLQELIPLISRPVQRSGCSLPLLQKSLKTKSDLGEFSSSLGE
jgi:hypothetical protein